jgi:predicted DNA binding CopG/RHH family protein
MAKTLVIPSFAPEAEEAGWYQAHKQEVEKEFMRAWKEGKTFRASSRGRNLKPVTIRLSEDDIDAARKQASERGMGYQTYIRTVLHQALRRKRSR